MDEMCPDRWIVFNCAALLDVLTLRSSPTTTHCVTACCPPSNSLRLARVSQNSGFAPVRTTTGTFLRFLPRPYCSFSS